MSNSNSNSSREKVAQDEAVSSLCEEQSSLSLLNLTKLDPPRWGWGLHGGILDVLSPQERARRKSSRTPTPTVGTSVEEETSSTRNASLGIENGSYTSFTYHRGESGKEARHSKTGKLVNDIERTDSNHKFEPNVCFKNIKVQFPLYTVEEDEHDNISNEQEYFRDVVTWDLNDSVAAAPHPMKYASDLAYEYGLTFGQTLDLASSIQSQIDAIVKRIPKYREAITVTDPNGTERSLSRPFPPQEHTDLGNSDGEAEEPKKVASWRHASKGKKVKGAKWRTSSPASTLKTTTLQSNTASDGTSTPKKRAYKPKVKYHIPLEVCREVVQRQSFAEKKILHVKTYGRKKISSTSAFRLGHNLHCHICHARREKCCTFPCQYHNHVYCDMHLQNRLGFSFEDIQAGRVTDFNCPICTLACTCAKCNRRVEQVASELKAECAENNISEHALLASYKPSMDIFYRRRGNRRDAASSRSLLSTTAPLCNTTPKAKVGKKGALDECSVASSHGAKANSASKRKRNVPSPNPNPNPNNTPPHTCAHLDKKLFQVPPNEFPKEIYNGEDMEPFSETTDSANAVLDRPRSVVTPPPPPSVAEAVDGNIDYCFECKRGGDVICCDECPRAYHAKCLPFDVIPHDSNHHLICTACRRDQNMLPQDTISGDGSLLVISHSLCNIRYVKGLTKFARILAKIHSMIIKLIQYDFGSVFQEPVQNKECPSYKKIIKHPMDFTTLCIKLIQGKYLKCIKSAMTDEQTTQAFDGVITTVLNDLEIIWHNCMIFNELGSTMYRMALVQKTKCLQFLKHNILPHLNGKVKMEVYLFAHKCETERRTIDIGNATIDATREAEVQHAIHVPNHLNGTSRIIAVVDPNTNEVIKRYTNVKAASAAAMYLFQQLAHKPAFIINDCSMNSYIRRGGQGSDRTLFGYRWMYDDDLEEEDDVPHPPSTKKEKHNRHARINARNRESSKAPTDPIGPKDLLHLVNFSLKQIYVDESTTNLKSKTTLYDSMEDAYFSAVTDDRRYPTDFFKFPDFQSTLLSLFQKERDSGGSIHAFGFYWSFVLRTEKKDVPLVTAESLSYSQQPPSNVLESCVPEHTIIVKKNVRTSQIIQGFETEHRAFEDWIDTLFYSRNFHSLVRVDKMHEFRDIFMENWLHGTSLLDDISWCFTDSYLEDIEDKSHSSSSCNASYCSSDSVRKRGPQSNIRDVTTTNPHKHITNLPSLKLKVIVDGTNALFSSSESSESSRECSFNDNTIPWQQEEQETDSILMKLSKKDDDIIESVVEAMERRQSRLGEDIDILDYSKGNNNDEMNRDHMESALPSSLSMKIPKRRNAAGSQLSSDTNASAAIQSRISTSHDNTNYHLSHSSSSNTMANPSSSSPIYHTSPYGTRPSNREKRGQFARR